jgi:hypothetical protein
LPPSEQERADALQRALEGRQPRTDPSAQALVPGELIATARALGAIESGDGLPSPTFVLGLEEQLRTDLRLGLTGVSAPDQNPSHPSAGPSVRGVPRSVMILLAALLIAATLLGAIWHAGPYNPLYQARLRLDAMRWTIAGLLGSGSDGGAEFEQGKRLLEDARAVVERPSSDGARLQRVLSRLPALYSVGSERATASPDGWPLMRARIEVQSAVAELERLGAVAPPEERAALEETRDALAGILDPNRPGPVAGVVPTVPTDVPTGISTAPPVATAATTRIPAPTEVPPTRPPPTAAIAPATATATATSSPTVPPPPPEQPGPTETSRPVDPTGTPGGVVPSPTRDAWPTATPGSPGATQPLPTTLPTEQVRPPQPPGP